MLIRGDQLTDRQREEVLRVFVLRWTHENAKQTYHGRCPACEQARACRVFPLPYSGWHARHAPLVSDVEWLQVHAFHFLKDGSRLMANKRYTEPACLATTSTGY